MFALNPQICSYDVTEGTNSEKRKLFIGINYDENGKSNRHTHIFLPSGRRWVFNWIARNAIPTLHGKKVCDQVEVNLFDEDTNEYLPFENAKDVYPNSSTCIC